MQKKLSKAFILLIIMSVSIVGFFSFLVLEDYYFKSIREDLSSDAVLIRDVLETYLVQDEEDAIKEKVSSLSKEINKNIIIIKNGLVVADSITPSRVGNREPAIYDVSYEKPKFSNLRQIWAGKMFFVEMPFTTANDYWIIKVLVPIVKVKGALLKVSLIIMVAALLSGLVALLFSVRFSRRIVSPIKEMIQVTKEISRGNFTRVSRIKYQDELGQLEKAFNFMAEKLKQSLDDLDDRTTKMEAILSSMVDGVLAVDEHGKIILVNPVAEKMFNIDKKEAYGRHLIEVIRNYELNEFINVSLKKGVVSFKELVLLPGEQILRVHVSPFKDFSGKIMGVVAVIRDITELRRLEKMRSDFVANVSHELRTPLTSIKGFVETLLDGAYRDPSLSKRFLSIIDFEARRLYRLINDLLDLSQLETNQVRLNLEDVSLKEIIEEVMMIFDARLKEKDLKFSTQLSENLSKVKADPDLLRQVFINLVDNAVKYTPPGGKIWIEAQESDEFIEVGVCDTGIGIPTQDIPRLFERFYRVDKARSRQLGGTGLGLSIVKHIVKSLGGDIKVESKLGEGSKFILTLKKAILTNN